MTEDTQKNDFRFELIEPIAVLSTNKKGWTKEVNLVSYNGKKPTLDIRWWSPNKRMTRGITLTKAEALALKEVLNTRTLEEL